MKIELALAHIEERRWIGLTMVDGELFKVTLLPGSATEEWKASLQATLFCELDPEKPLFKAVEKEFLKPSQNMTQDEMQALLKLIEDKPELMREIEAALKGGE